MGNDNYNREEERTQPEPTDTIELSITMTVGRRENYQEQISNISDYVMAQFPELKREGMTSPLKIRVKIKNGC